MLPKPPERGDPPGVATARRLLPEPLSEARLDGLLLTLLDGDSDVFAEVFVERASSWRARVASDRSDSTLVARCESGVAMRRLAGAVMRAGHVGTGDEEALARRLSATSGAVLGAGDAALRRSDVAGGEHARACEATRRRPPALPSLDDVESALSEALPPDEGVGEFRCELRAWERDVDVVSSEWGHASDRQAWTTAHVEVEVRAGGSTSRAGRSAGAPPAPPGSGPAWARLRSLAREALEAAISAADAREAPRAALPVVLAPAAAAVLVHEVVGHGLEGDVVARGASWLGARLGEPVGPPALRVVDDPSLVGLAGSRRVDDEGAPSRPVELISDGVAAAVLLDAQRSGFVPARCTGHGRRQGRGEPPLPRLANTFLCAGTHDPEELVRRGGRALVVERLERAAVDASSGDLRLRVAESRLVEAGSRTPLRPFELAGNARVVLHALEGIGADFAWDDGTGTCGRDGQWIPVASGAPTLRVAEGALRVV